MISVQPVDGFIFSLHPVQYFGNLFEYLIPIGTPHSLIHVTESVNSQYHQMSPSSPGNIFSHILQHFIIVAKAGKHIYFLCQHSS